MPKARITRSLAALMLLALAGCSSVPKLPSFPQGGGPFDPPPVPEGLARVYFYRDTIPDESGVSTMVSIDNREVGEAIPGGSSYVDLRPGQHVISVESINAPKSAGKRFTVKAGQTGYVSIHTRMPDSADTFGSATEYGPELIFPYGTVALQTLHRLRFYGEAHLN